MSDYGGSGRKSRQAFVERMNNVIDPERDDIQPPKWRENTFFVLNNPFVMGVITFLLVLLILYVSKPPMVHKAPENKLEQPTFSWPYAAIYASVSALIVILVPLGSSVVDRFQSK